MRKFFAYNWQVRDEWFEWCEQLNDDELVAQRPGGVNSILYTFFHIMDGGIQGKDDIVFDFNEYHTLEKVNYQID